jgi:VWFA-related protein
VCPALTYGAAYLGEDLDWFDVANYNDRTVIKDLGKVNWNDKFKISVVTSLPEMKPGEQRRIAIDTSGKPGRNGIDGAPGRNGGEGPLESVMGAEPGANGRPNTDPGAVYEVWRGPSLSPGAAASKTKARISLPVMAKAVLGHMYAIHVVNPQSDFYVLVHVDALVRGDNCTISWKRLSDTSSPASPEPGKTKFNPILQPAVVASSQSTSVNFAPASDSANPALKPPVLKPGQPTSLSDAKTAEKPRLKAFGSSLDRLKWDPAKQAAVEISDANNKRESSEDVVRVETRLVVSNVLVLDQKGRAVEGLTQNDFVVTEDGQPQQIGHFSLGDDASVGRSIVLILDYSSSLAPYIDLSVAAAKNLVDQLGPKDRMAIVTDDVELLVDFTRDKSQLKEGLDSLAKKATADRFGKSAQFSALLATLRELFSVEDIRPIVIFQTDGDQIGFMQPVDSHTAQNPRAREKIVQFSLNDVNSVVEKSPRITIYTVLPGFRLIGLPLSEQARRADIIVQNDMLTVYHRKLKTNPNLPPPPPLSIPPQASAQNAANRLAMEQAAAGVAEISGGKTFFLEQAEQAGEIYSQILSDVNRRYVIGYYPTNKAGDGKRRRVVIEVRNHPEYSIEGRKSYIAAAAP